MPATLHTLHTDANQAPGLGRDECLAVTSVTNRTTGQTVVTPRRYQPTRRLAATGRCVLLVAQPPPRPKVRRRRRPRALHTSRHAMPGSFRRGIEHHRSHSSHQRLGSSSRRTISRKLRNSSICTDVCPVGHVMDSFNN